MSSMVEFMKGWLKEEDNIELPFEEKSLTKEECYDLCRKTNLLLENSGCKPYTLFNFREGCNNIARRSGSWKEYFEHCAKYIEFYVYRDFSQKQFYRSK